MYIGLDFDGVIANCKKLKSLGCTKLFSVSIPEANCTKKYIFEHNLLTPEQYRQLQVEIYVKKEYSRQLEPITGALIGIKKLLAQGHHLKIVTSRYDESFQRAKEWLEHNKISLPLESSGRGTSKLPFLKGYSVFVDDEVEKLLLLTNGIANTVVFSADVPEVNGIHHVTSWTDLLTYIDTLK